MTYIWDIEDLEKPVQFSRFVADVTSIDHNQYIKGQFSYQSNDSAGLRIMVSDVKWCKANVSSTIWCLWLCLEHWAGLCFGDVLNVKITATAGS